MNEVTITLELTTGTTVADPEDAKRIVLDMLLENLRAARIMASEEEPNNGLFNIRIVETRAEPL